jgi:hypothetical protein
MKVVFPFCGTWQVGGDDGQVVGFRRADNMERASTFPSAEYQATVSSRIFRIILDDLSCANNPSDFSSTDHSFRSGHLLHSVWEEQNFACRYLANLLQDAHMRAHR